MAEDKQAKYQHPVRAILTGISDLFRKPQVLLELNDSERLDGKKVLVTGASSGLGFATAVELARRGAFVVMANRSGYPEKLREVRKKSGSDEVEMINLDLSDLSDLRDVALEIREKYGTMDVVICNAAMVAREGRRMQNGLDEMFVVNYLAKFIMIHHLIKEGCINFNADRLPRIIFVASESHRNAGAIQWESFGKFEPYGTRRSVELYGYYKLLLLTFVNELSRRLNHGEVKASVFSLCPGPVNSNIAREAPPLFQPLLRLVFKLFFRSPTRACKPVIYLATANEIEGKPLDYLFLMQRKEMDSKALDPKNGMLLWQESEALIQSLNLS